MSVLFDPNRISVPDDEGPETVWQLTSRIRACVEDEFPKVWVVGQVSNLKRHTSGHVFFTLKDERAAIRCVVWKSAAGRLPPEMTDGLEVEARGHIGVFESQGNYQLYVSIVVAHGVGALEAAFRRLKEKLEKEGLFDPARKKPLPAFPRRVGVVTSPTGAAVRDIIHVLTRRWPAVEIVLAPSRVQGEGAAAEIVRCIRNLNRLPSLDVIIVGRGGGSLEDLWPFNEEVVARAIFASRVPVVSAVGHETDFSISDFVADVRAPTPSAAAEIAVRDRREVAADLQAKLARLARGLRHRLDAMKHGLALVETSRYFRYPQELVLGRVQTLDDLAGRLMASVREMAAEHRVRLEGAASRLAEHAPRVARQRALGAVRMLAFRLHSAQRTLLVHRWGARVGALAERLTDLAPDRVLARGYSRTVLERTGQSLTRAADARRGDLLRTHLSEGDLMSEVTSTDTGTTSRDRKVADTRDEQRTLPRRRRNRRRNTGPTLFDER
ncbi:MAG TPA: exodeoxyribonuclease VII large subunit [Phycisphaerae bacterium]|nr:exodeoxyribonuclease VII large subunit [Phycisphaerae bacterium]